MADINPSQPPIEVLILECLQQILLELRGMGLAIKHMATQDRTASPDDFDMSSPSSEQEVTQVIY